METSQISEDQQPRINEGKQPQISEDEQRVKDAMAAAVQPPEYKHTPPGRATTPATQATTAPPPEYQSTLADQTAASLAEPRPQETREAGLFPRFLLRPTSPMAQTTTSAVEATPPTEQTDNPAMELNPEEIREAGLFPRFMLLKPTSPIAQTAISAAETTTPAAQTTTATADQTLSQLNPEQIRQPGMLSRFLFRTPTPTVKPGSTETDQPALFPRGFWLYTGAVLGNPPKNGRGEPQFRRMLYSTKVLGDSPTNLMYRAEFYWFTAGPTVVLHSGLTHDSPVLACAKKRRAPFGSSRVTLDRYFTQEVYNSAREGWKNVRKERFRLNCRRPSRLSTRWGFNFVDPTTGKDERYVWQPRGKLLYSHQIRLERVSTGETVAKYYLIHRQYDWKEWLGTKGLVPIGRFEFQSNTFGEELELIMVMSLLELLKERLNGVTPDIEGGHATPVVQ